MSGLMRMIAEPGHYHFSKRYSLFNLSTLSTLWNVIISHLQKKAGAEGPRKSAGIARFETIRIR